jgi:peptide/nickel transport system substrate-binding protein
MTKSYWDHVSQRQRLGRRRFLIGAVGASAGAALLAACGGSSGKGSKQESSASLLTKPADTTAAAKSGGVLKDYAANDITHFDALSSNSASTVGQGTVFAYTRLLKFKSAIYPGVADGSVEPEMAESYEVSPDRLTITMKVRQGQKWDARTPTNGRIMDAGDILFSWGKFSNVNPAGANFVNSRNPAAPIDSLSAPDGRTIVVKLKIPDATALGLLASTDGFYILPREAEGGFDPTTTVRGNGPWQLAEYQPSTRFVWRRNPDYYIKGRPFPDTIERPIITEPAQRFAQFKAGNIYTDVVANSQEQVIQLHKDVPRADLYLPMSYPTNLTPSVWFGYEGDSPFKDKRVRQAFSMMVDREAFDSAINNSDAFKAAGLDPQSAANACIVAGWGPYWLDPNSKDFGENAKYLKFNLEEAKKLLSAAGKTNIETTMFSNSEQTYGAVYLRSVEVLAGFFASAGVNVRQSTFTYTEYLNNYYFGYRSGASTTGGSGDKKGYNGVTVQAERPYASAVNLMLGSWHSAGGAFHGLTPTGSNAFAGDPALDAMIEKIQGEFDQKTQISLTHDVIRYVTGQTYFIPRPVANRSFEVWWPAVANHGINERWAQNNATPTEAAINWWIDQTKAPFV